MHHNIRRRWFAWLMNLVSDSYERLVADRKRILLSRLRGTVIEIGAGTGPNLQYLSPGVRWTAIEPNIYMHPYLRRRAAQHAIDLEILQCDAERLSGIADESVDGVVATLVFCSVRDVQGCLRELRRVLKPGGSFVFVEHVAAPVGTMRRALQRIACPVWSCIADGCHPDRETLQAIERAGFSRIELDTFEISLPLIGPHVAGTAFK